MDLFSQGLDPLGPSHDGLTGITHCPDEFFGFHPRSAHHFAARAGWEAE
jgi:hypothetical protein